MAEPPCSCHGNVPQRQSTLLPRVAKWGARLALKTMSPRNSLNRAEEFNLKISRCVFCEKEKRINGCYSRRFKGTSSKKWKKRPDNVVKSLLRKLRIPPEAQRILGNSWIALVSLKRLNFSSIFLSSLQPVVGLVRLQHPTHAAFHHKTLSTLPQQIEPASQSEDHILEITAFKPEESSEISQTETKTQTKATTSDSCDICQPEEPEHELCMDSESFLDQPFILFDSDSDHIKTDSETFYLDPDPDQTLVIELDPDAGAGQARCRLIQTESKAKHHMVVVQMDDSEDKKTALCCLQKKSEAEAESKESEDFCGVCLNGGHLLCCDRCPKVYHLVCHIPPLIGCPKGDWVCTLCRTEQDPVEVYDCEKISSCDGFNAPYTLCSQDQRRCEKLTLLLYCHVLSAPFHEPVSPWAQNYYQIIKKPIDLSVIRKKLDRSKTLHYFTAEQFVDDVLLMFKNCSTFNYPDSEVAQAGRNLEVFFLNQLREIFPSVSQNKTNKARLQWFCKKKKKECHRKKKEMIL